MYRMQEQKLYNDKKQTKNTRQARDQEVLQILQEAYLSQGDKIKGQ
jgi:hypothetical protein